MLCLNQPCATYPVAKEAHERTTHVLETGTETHPQMAPSKCHSLKDSLFVGPKQVPECSSFICVSGKRHSQTATTRVHWSHLWRRGATVGILYSQKHCSLGCDYISPVMSLISVAGVQVPISPQIFWGSGSCQFQIQPCFLFWCLHLLRLSMLFMLCGREFTLVYLCMLSCSRVGMLFEVCLQGQTFQLEILYFGFFLAPCRCLYELHPACPVGLGCTDVHYMVKWSSMSMCLCTLAFVTGPYELELSWELKPNSTRDTLDHKTPTVCPVTSHGNGTW